MTMPSTTNLNAQADYDKLGENHFILKIGSLALGAFAEIDGLTVERDILEYTEGGMNEFVHKLPGRLKYPNLTLKRGVTDQDALLKWFFDSQRAAQLMDVTVTLADPTGAPKRVWGFAQAFPVKWTGPKLAAGSDSPATEAIEVAHQGLKELKV